MTLNNSNSGLGISVDENGQVYLDFKEKIPVEDSERYKEAELEEALREQAKRFEADLRALAKDD